NNNSDSHGCVKCEHTNISSGSCAPVWPRSLIRVICVFCVCIFCSPLISAYCCACCCVAVNAHFIELEFGGCQREHKRTSARTNNTAISVSVACPLVCICS